MQTMRQLPLGGLGLLFGIDRLLATATATTNMIGNCVAVFVLAKWEGAFDPVRFAEAQAACLNQRAPSAPVQKDSR
jgi:aerobic C4-dicarboxylate transport protein